MKKLLIAHLFLLFCVSSWGQLVSSSSLFLDAKPIPTKTLFYDYGAKGELMPRIHWGIDQAWISEPNMLQGRNYLNLGRQNIDVARISFQPCYALSNGGLSSNHLVDLKLRLDNVALLGAMKPQIYLNSDPKGLNGAAYTVNSTYNSITSGVSNWVKLMKATGLYIENAGYTVASVAPYNEPDYGWGQGDKTKLNNICKSARADSWFAGKRLMTGNTLNCDKAWEWFSACQDNSDEANTHQLAGSFTNYVSFFEKVKDTGKILTQDEMHNVMEAMVGANYGMDYGIWWGTAEHARAQFCRANDGTGFRIGYLEHPDAFMAASVYHNTQDGVTEAYFGVSERQGTQSSMGLVSRDRDVYYDGYGPTRAYYQYMPADPAGSYGTELQRNAEHVVNIQSGDDVQPSPVVGTWQLMNASNGMVLTGTPSWSGWDAYKVTATTGSRQETQAWSISPLPENIGGDFSYYTIKQTNLQWWDYYLDDLDWSFEEAKDVIVYPGGGSGCEQWWFEYAGNGAYYIHNRYSNLVLDLNGAQVVQRTCSKSPTQRWKLCDISVIPDRVSPAVPSNLRAEARRAAVHLFWDPVSDGDLSGYTILRCTTGQNDWNTIARAVQGTQFVDNTVVQGEQYTYKIKAIDKSSNFSAASSAVSSAPLADKGLVAHWKMDGDLADATSNLMHAASRDVNFSDDGHLDGAASLDGGYIQLPYQIGNMPEMTLMCYVKWNGGSAWQRIFDFGNGEGEYLFLTPSDGSGHVRFEIKHSGVTQSLTSSAPLTKGEWVHVALTTRQGQTCLYLDGAKAAESTSITLCPSDIKGVCNYLGRSQFAVDPMFSGMLDDVRVYNAALTQKDVQDILGAHNCGLCGDVTGDCNVDINDVTALVDIILGKGIDIHNAADIDTNHTINITDVTKLVDIILGK